MGLPLDFEDNGMIDLCLIKGGPRKEIDPMIWHKRLSEIRQQSEVDGVPDPDKLKEIGNAFFKAEGLGETNVSAYAILNLRIKLIDHVLELKKKDGWERTPSGTPNSAGSTDST